MDAQDFQNMNDRNKGFKRTNHQYYPNPWTTKPGSDNDNTSTSSAKRIVPGSVSKQKEYNTPNNYERKEILNQVLEGLK